MTHIIQYTHVTPSQHEAGEGRGRRVTMTHIIQYTHVTPSQHEAGEGRGQEGDYDAHYTVYTRYTVPARGW